MQSLLMRTAQLAAVLMTASVVGQPSAAQAPAPANPAAAAVTCSVVMVPMRDGIKLSTEVYRPVAPGKYPVIMQRGPYHSAFGVSGCKTQPFLAAMAARGYVVINQEVRGTSRSEGELYPIVNESKDGYDAVEWAAAQPWSTGKVGMFSGSYLGMTQWQAAIARPPHLVTIVPSVAPTNFDQGWPYRTGALHMATAQIWGAGQGAGQLQRQLEASGAAPERIGAELAAYRQRTSQASLRFPAEMLPLAGDEIFNNEQMPWYGKWLEHPTLDSYWAASNVEDKYETLSIPVLSFGSYYDMFLLGTVAGHTGMQNRAATPQARANARLVIAGGGHAAGPNHYVGQLTFGAENELPQELTMRWFDHWLKGIENGVMDEPAVKLYVMLPPDQGSVGSGFWVSGSSYPLPGTQTVPYYLSGGHANSSSGGGILSLNPAPGSDQFRYDPANPVPTIGGVWCCGGLPAGAFDQRPAEIRPDVLVYTSAALTEPLSVVGDISVTLKASSTAPRTAFIGKLIDVHPDGYSQIISDGILVTPTAAPNSVGTYTIRMTPTATVFKPGHRIRLNISSSDYPRYNPQTNTDAPLGTAKELVVATQTIMWDGTSLNLPIAPISVPTKPNP